MSALSLCIASGKLLAVIPVASFTLAWTHSIEKTRWEEDWRIAADRLSISEARISGSGAGMEPGADAVLRDGVWHYQPATPPTARLHLAHSPYTAGYELCLADRCRPLASLLPGIDEIATIDLYACPAGTP